MIDFQERKERRKRAVRKEKIVNGARIALSLGSVAAFALLLTVRHPSETAPDASIVPTVEATKRSTPESVTPSTEAGRRVNKERVMREYILYSPLGVYPRVSPSPTTSR